MRSSSIAPDPLDTQAPELASTASRLLGAEVKWIEPLGGGRNSQVSVLCSVAGERYVIKRYVPSQGDGRDRLEVEFSSLRFLWDQGLRNIPRPLRRDRDTRCALYEYIDGDRMTRVRVGTSDLDEAVEFLAGLRALRHHPRSRLFPPASEACFSARALVTQLHQRLARLPSADGGTPHQAALQAFLRDEFTPAVHAITRWCQDGFARTRWRFDSVVPPEDQTLSPSDFGFHNAIRRRNGQIVFVDFEYFGWDDPVKMIVDFVLHPAMTLSEDLKRYVVGRLLSRFDDEGRLAERLGLLYPLWGLKWCLIFLNEFVPKDQARRTFAQRAASSEQAYAGQLSKARQMLHHIRETHASCPYLP